MIEGLEQLKDAYERMPESFFDWILESPVPVSYTHLTLPTNSLV